MKQKKPHHIAIVMDGNGRWAEQRGLERIEGHVHGVQVAKRTVEACIEHDIKILSLFAFSNENWARPKAEVAFLMDLFLQFLKTELIKLKENGVRLNFLGSREGLSEALVQEMDEAEVLTASNEKLILNIALNYSGKWDILNAIHQIFEANKEGLLDIDKLNEVVFGRFLSTSGLTEPDLFIRTSGEQRISNFFLWQIAYTELYFTTVCWPDFDKKQFMQALEFYSSRERRYGKTSRQIKDEKYV